ncbi:MAG: hypothetical protein EBV73_05730 [Rhodocyclales bacterium]|nr:hypothetical protein [Rhodocyclales bacterium]
MRLLILLQALSAVGYYLSAPFPITTSIALALLINSLALAWLWVSCASAIRSSTLQYRWARGVFTGTLFLLELLIGLTDSPVSMTDLQGLFNDAEVLFTGILLGLLWHQELLKVKLFTKR